MVMTSYITGRIRGIKIRKFSIGVLDGYLVREDLSRSAECAAIAMARRITARMKSSRSKRKKKARKKRRS